MTFMTQVSSNFNIQVFIKDSRTDAIVLALVVAYAMKRLLEIDACFLYVDEHGGVNSCHKARTHWFDNPEVDNP